MPVFVGMRNWKPFIADAVKAIASEGYKRVIAIIRNLKAKGHRGVFLHPIGFLCDHVEVLYDIDIAFKQFAEKEGMRLWRAESLNGSKTLTAALAEVVSNRVKALGP